MVGLGLCYTFLLSSLPHFQACIIDLHTSCLLGVRKKEPFYWDEKVRYTFQSSLWGLRAKLDISTNLTLTQENLTSLRKEKSGSFQGQSCEKVGDVDRGNGLIC